MIWFLIDLCLFWAMVVTAIIHWFGKIPGIVPLIFLIAFGALTTGIIIYEYRHALDYDEFMNKFKNPDDLKDSDDSPSNTKDAD